MMTALEQQIDQKMVAWLIGLVDQGESAGTGSMFKKKAKAQREDTFGRGFGRLRVSRTGQVTVARVIVNELIKEPAVTETVDELISLVRAGCNQLVLDLREVERITSSFVGTLAEAHRCCLSVPGGLLRLSGVRPEIRPIFRYTGLERELKLFEDLNTAVNSPWPLAGQPRPLPVGILNALTASDQDQKNGGQMPEIQAEIEAGTLVQHTLLQLRVDVGSRAGQMVRVRRSPWLIGRDSACRLRCSTDVVSRLHAQIETDGLFHWQIRDLGSRNGTFVNDVRIKEPHRLIAGDQIRIGPLLCTVLPGSSGLEESQIDDAVANWLIGSELDQAELNGTSTGTQEIVQAQQAGPAGKIRVTEIQGVRVIAPRTPEIVDEESAEIVQEALENAIQEKADARLVLDLGLVSAMSSRVLGVMLAISLKLSRCGGELRLAHPRPAMRARLEMFRVTDIVPLYETLDEAVVASWDREP